MRINDLFSYKELSDNKINLEILGVSVDINSDYFYDEIYDDLIEKEGEIKSIIEKLF